MPYYIIVSALNRKELAERVNIKRKEGYQVAGGFHSYIENTKLVFTQAMTLVTE